MAALRLRSWLLILIGLSIPVALLVSGVPRSPREIGHVIGGAVGLAVIPFAIAATWRSMQKMKTETPYTVSLLVFFILSALAVSGASL
jgi:hypothetical protein